MLDKNSLSLAYLLQAGYTHRELKEILFEKKESDALTLWEHTKEGNIGELSEGRREKILEKMKQVDEEKIASYLSEKSVALLPLDHPDYPQSLRSLGHAPAFLYVRGTLRSDSTLLGVVGSRKHTPYADRILRKILPDIIHAGVSIVSGGATGVDTMGHEIALREGGYTIVVFGTGIDRCYPSANRSLFESIIEKGGALISHFPLGTGPEAYNFPQRNEIVAGLSRGVLIPEAGLSSGTIITAQLALEHGRDVFAVPGDIDRSTSEGTNMLIASGQAKCVRCSADILEEYYDVRAMGAGMTPVIRTPPVFSNEGEQRVYERVESGYKTVDELLRETGFDMSDLLMHIAMLEIAGHMRMDEIGRYQIGE